MAPNVAAIDLRVHPPFAPRCAARTMPGRPMDDALANEVLAHAGALRALARQLVGDAAADDLVQDTSLAALRSPPPRAAGLWGWLAQVLRNLAKNERRAAARRVRRETGRPPPDAPEPAARVAERHEAVQRLTAALPAP